MSETLQQVIEQVQQLDPTEQELVAQRIKEILAKLEEERAWQALVNSPESLAYLTNRSAEIDKEIAS